MHTARSASTAVGRDRDDGENHLIHRMPVIVIGCC
jgi:hypothetical protein